MSFLDDRSRFLRLDRTEDDPKMIGLWKVGRTIGKGFSGWREIHRTNLADFPLRQSANCTAHQDTPVCSSQDRVKERLGEQAYST